MARTVGGYEHKPMPGPVPPVGVGPDVPTDDAIIEAMRDLEDEGERVTLRAVLRRLEDWSLPTDPLTRLLAQGLVNWRRSVEQRGGCWRCEL